MKLQTALNDKKEKLFKAKDVTKWGHNDIKELQRSKEILFADKDKAFKWMLPKET